MPVRPKGGKEINICGNGRQLARPRCTRPAYGRRLLRRLEIVGAEFCHKLAGCEHMSPHGFDHRFALGLGRVKAKLPIQREDPEIIRMGASCLRLTTWDDMERVAPARQPGHHRAEAPFGNH